MADSRARFAPGMSTGALPGLERGVLHVITGLDTGGAETQLATLALANHRAGRPVVVASLIAGGVHRARLAGAGVPVLDLGMRRGRRSLRAPLALARLIRTLKPAVVQSWLYHADLLSAIAWTFAGRWRKSRLYWGVRCSDLDIARYGPGLERTVRMCVLLSRLPHAVVANAEAGRTVHRALGYRTRTFAVIENGIDTERFRPDREARAEVRAQYRLGDDALLIAMVARVDPMKDYLTFIQALDRLPGVYALAIGERTEALPEVERMIRLGRRDDVPRLLAACDAVVSSSAFGEGFSNVLAEGMACALPAVATDVGDSARLVGDCGRTVPPRDPVALAHAVRAVLADDLKALGARARARIEDNFSVARMVAAFNRLHGL
jgi:glycosyltransferase involved in cell wall biosynthesis